jgi:drug/metabolite transporter (DMT)-like permease
MSSNLALMAVLSAMVKALGEVYPVGELLFFRFAFALLPFLFLLPTVGGLPALVTERPLEHAVRSVSGVLSISLFFFALTVIPLADATALAYAAPIFITVFSIPLLGEQIGPRRWSAVLIGFLGVLLIAQPTGASWGASWNVGTLAAVGSAFFGAFVCIWLRRLSISEKPLTITIYYNGTGMLLLGGWTLATGWVWPQGLDVLWLVGLGLIASLQQYLFTVSYRYAEASLLAPFEYCLLVFAAVIGFVFWGEIPALTTWAGAAVIIGAGLYVAYREARIKRRQAGAGRVGGR